MRIRFNELHKCDLFRGAVYEGGTKGNLSDEVISKIMNCGNVGGFRIKGNTNPFDVKYVILSSTVSEKRWMNKIDEENNILTYYGDNKTPGKEVTDTKKKGNLILKMSFDLLEKKRRREIPPFFVFFTEEGRNEIFKGVAVPKDPQIMGKDTLLTVEDRLGNGEIQNYKATFDILNIDSIDRKWLKDLEDGRGYKSQYAPKSWVNWVNTGMISLEQSKNEINEFTETDYNQDNGNTIYRLKREMDNELEREINKSRNRTKEERLARLLEAAKVPKQIQAVIMAYRRNSDVVVEVLERAKGRCEECSAAAPFIKLSNGTPYLEVHHKIRLADGGEDTVQNAVALCPNCHREAHYGVGKQNG